MAIDADTIEASVEIAAPVATVWELVQDPRNMRRWSPQTARSFLRGGVLTQGAKLFNINRKGLLVWPTTTEIVAFEPEKEIAWRVSENYMVWRLRLEASPGGTTLTQTREAPEGISNLSARISRIAFGGVDNFAQVLEADMAKTLDKIKAEAEAAA